jgi:dienelactone hydrolase
MVDSLSGRGLEEVCSSYRTLRSEDRIVDAFGALALVATHPKVDRTRIVLFGISHGGGTTLQAAAAATVRSQAPPSARFRGFFALYPRCADDNLPGSKLAAPLRIHTGELDDWTPAHECEVLAASLRRSGNDAQMTVYPGAHHSFDSQDLPTILHVSGVQNFSSGQLRWGATVGYSPSATQSVRENLLEQLRLLLD